MTTDTDKLEAWLDANCKTAAWSPDAKAWELRDDQISAFASAHIASLCGDVEPVAWVYWHPSDTTYDGPDTLHKKAVSRFTDDTRKAMLAKGWLFEPLYPATVAALKAENEALRAALQGLVDFHTKPAGVTVELISEKDLFSQAMADIDAREKKLVADAIAAITARSKT